MLIQSISQYLESHKRLVVPQLGTFIVKEPGRNILFSELLKRDDGVLRGLLRESGLTELEAAGEIDRFVFEARHAVQNGGEYPMDGFGTLKPGANGTIAFAYDPTVRTRPAAEPDPEPGPSAESAAESAATPAASSGPSGPSVPASETAETSAAAPSGATAPGAAADSAGPHGRPASAHPGSGAATPGATSPEAAAAPHGESASAHPASEGAHADTPRERPHRVRAERLARSVEQAFAEPYVSPSAKMNPDPSVRGLRYGKPPKTTDAYTYVDRPTRRRADRFLWIAIGAAVIALSAIAFGYWREHRERQAEAEYLEYRQSLDGAETDAEAAQDAAPGDSETAQTAQTE